MNLLIVDDEIFTREGLIEMLPLNSLGITETRQAFDGIDALDVLYVLKKFEPDILLADVRMPRMNGIDLAFKIRELYPYCSIIFMSGYCDKEYLKSAIKLKAIMYVEKPLELEEVESALKAAISENLKFKTINAKLENSIALEVSNNCVNQNIQQIISSCFSKETQFLLNTSCFLTILLKLQHLSEEEESIVNNLKNIIGLYNFKSFISIKNKTEIIIQLIFPNNNNLSANNSTLTSLFVSLGEYLSDHTNYYICVGDIVTDIKKIYKSSDTAYKMLIHSFFYAYNCTILPSININKNYIVDELLYHKFDNYLHRKDNFQIILTIKNLTLDINKCINTSPSYIRDIYYKLLLHISNFSNDMNLEVSDYIDSKYIFEEISNSPNIFVLEKLVINKINEFFHVLDSKTVKDNPVQSILEYIHNNYADCNLCLNQISEHTSLTPTYICVIFKEFTSKTVNKYINEFRIEKAKNYLKDSNISMSYIATKVGFSDGNYFSKIFRKATSFTPSEYRRHFCK